MSQHSDKEQFDGAVVIFVAVVFACVLLAGIWLSGQCFECQKP